MTFQFEKTRTTLELLLLEIKSSVEKIEELLVEITDKEKKITQTKEQTDGRNPRPGD